jgi:putative membrane protein
MNGWQMGRAGTSVLAALCVTLGACSGGDTGADSAMGDTSAGMMGADTATGAGMAGMSGAMNDQQIVAQVTGSNTMEIATSEIARDKATNADVKQFATDMVNEHQRMQGQVDSLTTRLNMTGTTPTDSMTQALDDARGRLQGEAAGAGFDRMYMDMQVQAHEATLNMLNQAAGATQNAELRTLIQGAIPAVQQHLDRARQIVSGLGTAG